MSKHQDQAIHIYKTIISELPSPNLLDSFNEAVISYLLKAHNTKAILNAVTVTRTKELGGPTPPNTFFNVLDRLYRTAINHFIYKRSSTTVNQTALFNRLIDLTPVPESEESSSRFSLFDEEEFQTFREAITVRFRI